MEAKIFASDLAHRGAGVHTLTHLTGEHRALSGKIDAWCSFFLGARLAFATGRFCFLGIHNEFQSELWMPVIAFFQFLQVLFDTKANPLRHSGALGFHRFRESHL